ncbi:MAG: helix-turn-helix transcriptional regulator [Lachnospiraceae bacterium]|jgi:transcriptional regulator with XRE-family HTH domain|nr:helix-turn-helix transcriptional regulator [Lachnospiraceae bacterium]
MELKSIRTQKGLTQQAVAEGIQCSATVYARYERGEREPSIEMLLKLAAFFDVTVDYLLGNSETVMSSFTKYEMDLVIAAREADDRAREDALATLRSHQVQKKKIRHA